MHPASFIHGGKLSVFGGAAGSVYSSLKCVEEAGNLDKIDEPWSCVDGTHPPLIGVDNLPYPCSCSLSYTNIFDDFN